MLFSNKPLLWLGLGVALIALAASALLPQTIPNSAAVQPSVSPEPIRIGVLAFLSGENASYGQSLQQGLDFAAQEINSNGGILGKKIGLVYEDSHLDSVAAANALNKFVFVDKLSMVISAEGSGPTLAVAPLADQTKTVLMVAIASTPPLKDAGDFVFRVVPSDSYQGKEMARLAQKLGFQKTAILRTSDSYGVGIRDVLKENLPADSLVADESFENGDADFRTQLIKIKASSPDAIVMVARNEAPAILKQAKELEINSQFIASETVKEKSILQASGSAAEGIFIPFYAEPTDYPQFKKRFLEKTGQEPGIYSNYGYDSLQVLAKAIRTAGTTDATAVKNALYQTDYNGATGIIQFDSFGEVTEKPFTVYRVENGVFVEFKP